MWIASGWSIKVVSELIRHASVAITTGLLQKLDREELQGVLGHELSHVRNFDIRFSLLVAVLVGSIALLADFFLRFTFWGGLSGRRSSRDSGGNGAAAIIAVGNLLRRIVLATNVAETSLTVPGIRYVVDPGTARISRYSHRTKVQRLPIEAISQASATQRSGRCGRVADGITIRLYDEDDFAARPEFTEPEILRTNLASVLLQMAALKLGDIEDFPFVEPPDRRQVRDGIALLEELGALDQDRLTKVGRQLARLPVDEHTLDWPVSLLPALRTRG